MKIFHPDNENRLLLRTLSSLHSLARLQREAARPTRSSIIHHLHQLPQKLLSVTKKLLPIRSISSVLSCFLLITKLLRVWTPWVEQFFTEDSNLVWINILRDPFSPFILIVERWEVYRSIVCSISAYRMGGLRGFIVLVRWRESTV